MWTYRHSWKYNNTLYLGCYLLLWRCFSFGSDDNMEMFKAYDLRFGGKVINNFDYYAAGQTSGNFQNGYMK